MRRGRGDTGAVLVEAAIALPVLVFVILAIIEVGGMLKAYSGAASAVREGGRSASLAGSDPMADASVLMRLAELSATLDEGEIELVAIWHPAGPGESLPASCLPATVAVPNTTTVGWTGSPETGSGACNVYVQPDAPGGAFAMAQGTMAQPAGYYFGCTGAADVDRPHKVDCNWPAASRQVLTSPRASATITTTDFVGVYIRVRHDSYTGVLDGGVTITDKGIVLIEPQGYAVS